jgi:cystathionine beta-lyase/cystathionine gamma-synthase
MTIKTKTRAISGRGDRPRSVTRKRPRRRAQPASKVASVRGRRRGATRAASGFATDAIHAGQAPDPTTGAIMPPIYATSTYVQPALGRSRGFDYARTINPTRLALEKNLAALEGGRFGYCFASGMSAIAAVMTLVQAGDHVVATRNVYGGTYRLFERVLRGYGLTFTWVDTADLGAVERALRPETRMIFVETPTNPILTLTDLRALSRLARRRGVIIAVDNTFMTPYFQRPLALGADVVVHSTTKFLNGHSDSLGGAVVTSVRRLADRVRFVQNSAGAVLSPFDAWLVLRGVKTLALRMQRHDENGRRVAAWLTRQTKVRRVYYPGLRSHPQHALARRQMSGFGAVVSFDLGSYRRAKRFLDRVRLCALAESLGGVETLIGHPATMTHGSVPAEERRALGITDGLVRISVGVEDVKDILADLAQALSRA